MKRRDFLAAAAVSPAAALPAMAQAAHPPCLPGYGALKTRAASKIEILYKTKHGQPNGLALSRAALLDRYVYWVNSSFQNCSDLARR